MRVNDSFESYVFSAPSTRRSYKAQDSIIRSRQDTGVNSRRGIGSAGGFGLGGGLGLLGGGELMRLNFEIKGSSVNIQQHPSTQHSQQRSKMQTYKTPKHSSQYPRDATPVYCDKSVSLYQNSVSCLSSSKEENERDAAFFGSKRLEQISDKLQSRLHTPTTSSKLY